MALLAREAILPVVDATAHAEAFRETDPARQRPSATL